MVLCLMDEKCVLLASWLLNVDKAWSGVIKKNKRETSPKEEWSPMCFPMWTSLSVIAESESLCCCLTRKIHRTLRRSHTVCIFSLFICSDVFKTMGVAATSLGRSYPLLLVWGGWHRSRSLQTFLKLRSELSVSQHGTSKGFQVGTPYLWCFVN